MSLNSKNDFLPTSRFFLLLASVFAVSVGYGIVLPLLPFLLERLLGDSARFSVAWHTGMLAGLYLFALFLFAPLWGRLSDRIGRRPVILIGLGGCVLALASFGLAQTLWASYLARALGGVMVSAVFPVTLAYISGASSDDARARRFAWMSAASTLGFLVGPVIGGTLTNVGSVGVSDVTRLGPTSLPFLVTAAASSVVWLAVYLWLPEPSVRPAPAAMEPNVQRDHPRLVNLLLLLALLGMFGLGSFEVAVALHGKQLLGLDPFRLGLIFMECSLVMVVVQLLVFSPLARRFNFSHVIAPAFLVMAAGLWLVSGATTFTALVLFVGLVAAGAGILFPLLAFQISLGAGTGQGAALGKQTAAGGAGQALGSAAAGWLFGLQPESPFWLTAGLLVIGAVISLTATRSHVRSN